MNQRTLLVTGAHGHLGRRVLELLVEKKLKNTTIVAGTRDPQKLQAPKGVVVRKVDFEAADLDAAFAGVDRLLLISTDALDRPGRRLEQHKAAIAAAQKAGVKHLLYTSMPNPTPTSKVLLAPDHRLTEEAIKAAPFGHTLLRNNLYMDLQLGALQGALAAGALYNAAGDGRVAWVSREDCAAVAAAALADEFDGRRVVDVSGPAAVSSAELAAIASGISGKELRHVSLPPSAARDGMVAAGLPAPFAAVLVSFDEAAADGDLATVTNSVAEFAGRAPTDLKTFLTNNKAAWVK
ncbi:MAG: NAD(P)H-binding protein [Deltaproteobacteria bacterium]|nr:NAD(P)H-binding protein [Deltaproteobacteria bacterium]